MAESSFFARNKAAIALTVLASAGAIGAYWYYIQQQAQETSGDKEGDNHAAKKKKNKKKKSKSSKEKTPETSAASQEKSPLDLSEAPFPVNDKNMPDFTEEDVAKLTEEQKEEWALALKNAGNAKYKNNEMEDAVAFYTAALKVKVDPVYYSNRSACWAAIGNHEEVIKDATEAIKLKPDYTKCILRRATSYEQLEQYPDAMLDLTALTIHGAFNSKSVEQTLERVLQKHAVKIVEKQMKERVPELPSASTIASFFGAFKPESNPEGISESSTGADKFLYDALQALNAKQAEKYEEADSLFNQAIKAYEEESIKPDSAEAAKATIAYEYGAIISFLKYDKKSIDAYITKAFALKPRARTYVIRALVKADDSTLEESFKDFEKAKELEPENPDIYYHFGQIYYLTGRFPEAEQHFMKAKKLNPENVFAYIQLACVIYKKGEADEAIKAFEEAKLRFPTSPEVLNYYGEILADKGDTQGAIKQFDIAIRLQKDLPVVSVGAAPLLNKGSLLQRDGLDDKGEVADLYTRAVEMDPKSEIARNHLAQVKLAQDDAEEAIRLFEEGSLLSRTFDEKVQSTSFAEATKMQMKIKADPYLSQKINEVLQQHALQIQR